MNFLPTNPLPVAEFIANLNEAFTALNSAIIGEVTSYNEKTNRYAFFDLKDEQEEAVINCFIGWKYLSRPIEPGMKIIVYGLPQIYPKSGRFTFNVSGLEIAGAGNLKRSFDLLVKKLAAEGLFRSERKRSIPALPQNIGLISSKDAAGFTDFLNMIEARWPAVKISFINVAVQGLKAEEQIIQALNHFNLLGGLDCLAIIRGGGSPEDLAIFNSELLGREIAKSKIPVITGIGHEKDTTIADLTADLRASTPTHAAMLLTPDRREITQKLLATKNKFLQEIERKIENNLANLGNLKSSLIQQLDQKINTWENQFLTFQKLITSLSPLQILQRGYTITCTQLGQNLKSAKKINQDDSLKTIFYQGVIYSKVTKIEND